MAAPYGNTNRAGKGTVKRDRISVHLAVSEKNGLLELLSRYLSEQGIEPTDAAIREQMAKASYRLVGEWLKREIEVSDAAIIA